MRKRFATSELDYGLPPELIAQIPTERRGDSRLLVVDRATANFDDGTFTELGDYLRPTDVLVLNNTRVVPAKFTLRRSSGGRIDGLFLSQPQPGRWEVMLKGAGRIRSGELLEFDIADSDMPADERGRKHAPGELHAVACTNCGRGRWQLDVNSDRTALELLDSVGRMPLPPYIKRVNTADHRDALDRERYQTVFAAIEHAGAVAAPTAGLHFTDQHLTALQEHGLTTERVTLHVGYGTFAPLEADDLSDHPMHEEYFQIEDAVAARLRTARASNRRIVAVGTTSARVLETAWTRNQWQSGLAGSTGLFCYPPYEFGGVDALLTNFHLPRSTLLALVMAFAGVDLIRRAYRHAIEQRYRFFSYGDAMLIV